MFLKELDMLYKKTPGKNISLTDVAQWNEKEYFSTFESLLFPHSEMQSQIHSV